jgi:predicted adenine nucleotide alpha hydrolase (AANH) superfamily ATPase
MCIKKKKYLMKKIINNLKHKYYYYFYISKLLDDNEYRFRISTNKEYDYGFILLYNFEIDFSKGHIRVYLYNLFDEIMQWDNLNKVNNRFISKQYFRSYLTFSYGKKDIELLNNLIDFIEKQGGLKHVI